MQMCVFVSPSHCQALTNPLAFTRSRAHESGHSLPSQPPFLLVGVAAAFEDLFSKSLCTVWNRSLRQDHCSHCRILRHILLSIGYKFSCFTKLTKSVRTITSLMLTHYQSHQQRNDVATKSSNNCRNVAGF